MQFGIFFLRKMEVGNRSWVHYQFSTRLSPVYYSFQVTQQIQQMISDMQVVVIASSLGFSNPGSHRNV